jgi:hypothetical protein
LFFASFRFCLILFVSGRVFLLCIICFFF